MFVHPYIATLLAAAKHDDYLAEARRAASAREENRRTISPAAAPRHDRAMTPRGDPAAEPAPSATLATERGC